MIVAGIMSGTSADGINVALLRVSGRALKTRFELLAHGETAYPEPVRRAVLAMMDAKSARVADLARLDFLLGELYADALLELARKHRLKAELVGCHGQTVYHQGKPQTFHGRRIACTMQIGEGAVVAARAGVPVVSGFRSADMAAGGAGAPLVPYLDYLLYRDARVGRIMQNLGGIGNLTAIAAGAEREQLIAFDTGPGNMVIDAVMERLFARKYDVDGKIATSGKVVDAALRAGLRHPYFKQRPPKTAGREQFGVEFVSHFVSLCGSAKPQDIVATATALTAHSISEALQRFVLTGKKGRYSEYILAGGGSRNQALVAMLRAEVEPLGLKLRQSDEFGIPASAKEAVAFALLAYATWNREPSNVPAATGATRPAILGKISYA